MLYYCVSTIDNNSISNCIFSREAVGIALLRVQVDVGCKRIEASLWLCVAVVLCVEASWPSIGELSFLTSEMNS